MLGSYDTKRFYQYVAPIIIGLCVSIAIGLFLYVNKDSDKGEIANVKPGIYLNALTKQSRDYLRDQDNYFLGEGVPFLENILRQHYQYNGKIENVKSTLLKEYYVLIADLVHRNAVVSAKEMMREVSRLPIKENQQDKQFKTVLRYFTDGMLVDYEALLNSNYLADNDEEDSAFQEANLALINAAKKLPDMDPMSRKLSMLILKGHLFDELIAINVGYRLLEDIQASNSDIKSVERASEGLVKNLDQLRMRYGSS